MVHTGEFYINLNKEDIKYLIHRFSEHIAFITNTLNETFKWSRTNIYFDYREEGYSRHCWVLKIKLDFVEMLGKPNISDEDYKNIETYIKSYMFKLFGNRYTIEDLMLTRIDYRIDVKLNKSDREALLMLLSKSYQKHGFKKIKKTKNIIGEQNYKKLKECHGKNVEEIIYFQSKSVGLKVYDKETERISKGIEVKDYERDVLRMEVMLYNRHLNYKNRKNKTPKNFETYFNKEFFEKYVIDHLVQFMNIGDYYKITVAEKIINQSELSERQKKFLREFLIDVSKGNLTNVMTLMNEKGKSKYSYATRRRALKLLKELDINPVCIPKNWKCRNHIENPIKMIGV